MPRYNVGTYIYGFDRPLAQYFLDKGGKYLVGPLSALYGDASTLIGVMQKEKFWDKIPKEHQQAIIGDEPV
jgi:hypothetical protein